MRVAPHFVYYFYMILMINQVYFCLIQATTSLIIVSETLDGS